MLVHQICENAEIPQSLTDESTIKKSNIKNLQKPPESCL